MAADDPIVPDDPDKRGTDQPLTTAARLRRFLVGAPRDLEDRRLFHRLSLIPFLAWVGLGADGLSSSSYGPEQAYLALGTHTFLALGLVALVGATVVLISLAYSRIIEQFPSGGGGYVVATKLLGANAGVTSGAALLVDYVLTITTSLAAAGDAIFSFLPPQWHGGKLLVEIVFVLLLTTLNVRGVRESVLTLVPVFIVFLITHVLLIGGGILVHAADLPRTIGTVRAGYTEGVSALGMGGLLLLFVRAYSLGGGTYTGIEAVSNGVPMMREPRVRTAKRTMLYMATSLALTASGLLLCYLLWQVSPVPGQTLNAVLVGRLTAGLPFGSVFVVLTLLSEGLLLVVAAQAGFLDGPRVLANMAIDSWMPHRFAGLSERLTAQNGILLMGLASLAALLYTRGNVSHLIVMYSINVFLTFSLSMFGMLRFWVAQRGKDQRWRSRTLLFGSGFVLCATILVITIVEKFVQGGWVTVVVTGLLIALCFRVRRHYIRSNARMARLQDELSDLPTSAQRVPGAPDTKAATAVVLVGSYGGLGIHTVLNIFRVFPNHYRSVVFVSVGVIDSGEFKGQDALDALRTRTSEMLERYVALVNGLGMPAAYRYAIGTDAVDEAERLCLAVAREFPRTTFFAGKLIFQREQWYHRVLHNETALAIQKRLQWAGKTMVTLPVRLREG